MALTPSMGREPWAARPVASRVSHRRPRSATVTERRSGAEVVSATTQASGSTAPRSSSVSVPAGPAVSSSATGANRRSTGGVVSVSWYARAARRSEAIGPFMSVAPRP
jgi:hypothetical protein